MVAIWVKRLSKNTSLGFDKDTIQNHLQRLLYHCYPPQCINCDALLLNDFSLCPACRACVAFIQGKVCRFCGVEIIGYTDELTDICDACLTNPRPWDKGRAVFYYTDVGQRLVLAFKYADRLDLIHMYADWMLSVADPLLCDDPVFVPIPLHPIRQLKRKYNQAAVLAHSVAQKTKCDYVGDVLERTKHTPKLNHFTDCERFDLLVDSIRVRANRCACITGRAVVLLDDVMTSGATLSAATRVLYQAGAKNVSILVLARAASPL